MNDITDFKEVTRKFNAWSHLNSMQSIELNKINARLKRLEKLFSAIQEAVEEREDET